MITVFSGGTGTPKLLQGIKKIVNLEEFGITNIEIKNKNIKDGIDEDKEQYQLDYFKMVKEYTKAFNEDSTEL